MNFTKKEKTIVTQMGITDFTNIKIAHSAGTIILNPEGKIAIVQQEAGTWSFPKGTPEPKEDLTQTALRETTEETGITDITILKTLPTYGRQQFKKGGNGFEPNIIKIMHLFLAQTASTSPMHPIDPKNPEARWVTLYEAQTLMSHPKDKEFLEMNRAEIDKMFHI